KSIAYRILVYSAIALQVTLLRFIEDHVMRPLGATKSRKVNVRIIAASNVCLSELVANGIFRQDFYLD
ncbi:MAG: sigma-54 factor interaction domain-containing protein, partial [Methylococcaceae bacterium]|nr:sigma-54 factor interaction domain-containing protein [Methylococcaceae bacterium]